MDGTGKLFEKFAQTLDATYQIEIVRYPVDQCLSYLELEGLVQAAFPLTGSFVVIAESFSSPLAVLCAARRPSNLKGLVLCAGFVSAPVRGWRNFLCHYFAPLGFVKSLPDFIAIFFLVGLNAPTSLLAAVRSAISSVKPEVLVDRVHTTLMCDVRSELLKVTVPILYLRAKQDRLIGASCLRVL